MNRNSILDSGNIADPGCTSVVLTPLAIACVLKSSKLRSHGCTIQWNEFESAAPSSANKDATPVCKWLLRGWG